MKSSLLSDITAFDSLARRSPRAPPALRLILSNNNNTSSTSTASTPVISSLTNTVELGPGDDTIIDADETGPLNMYLADPNQDADRSLAEYTTESFRPRRIMMAPLSPNRPLTSNYMSLNLPELVPIGPLESNSTSDSSSTNSSSKTEPTYNTMEPPSINQLNKRIYADISRRDSSKRPTIPKQQQYNDSTDFIASNLVQTTKSCADKNDTNRIPRLLSSTNFYSTKLNNNSSVTPSHKRDNSKIKSTRSDSINRERSRRPNNKKLFTDCVFAIEGYVSANMTPLRTLLSNEGATVVPLGTSPLISVNHNVQQRYYLLPIVCPALVGIKMKHAEAIRLGNLYLVTDNWVYNCLKASTILHPTNSSLYVPYLLKKIPELENVQIAVNVIVEHDRDTIICALKSMGAQIHGTFRVTSDILVSNVYDEEMEKRASTWGSRITSKAWVEAMLVSGQYELPRNFSISRPPRPLDEVILYSTSTDQTDEDLYAIAQSLGARMLPSFSLRCTHILHEGIKEPTEVQVARSRGRHIVSPWWLILSSQAQKRLPESEFPPTFTPHASSV